MITEEQTISQAQRLGIFPPHPDYPRVAREYERAIGRHQHLLNLFNEMRVDEANGLKPSVYVSQYDLDRALGYANLCYDAESYLWSLHRGKTCMCSRSKGNPCRLCVLKSRYELWLEEQE